ncbi:hypothetical protein ACFL35_20415, partial [Candidatus Riflebacteria bacterium]
FLSMLPPLFFNNTIAIKVLELIENESGTGIAAIWPERLKSAANYHAFARKFPFLFLIMVYQFEKYSLARIKHLFFEEKEEFRPVIARLNHLHRNLFELAKLPSLTFNQKESEELLFIDLIVESAWQAGDEFTLAHWRLFEEGSTLSALSPQRLEKALNLLADFGFAIGDKPEVEELSHAKYAKHMAVIDDSPKENLMDFFPGSTRAETE